VVYKIPTYIVLFKSKLAQRTLEQMWNITNVVLTDIKHSYFCQLPNTAYQTDIAQTFMKTDLQQTCLTSDRSKNEQQVWVTVLSLQCSSLLEISSSWFFVLCS